MAAMAASMSAERVSIIHNNLGLAFHCKEQPATAAAHYRKAIEATPKDARAHNNLGVAMAEVGQVKEAEACYRKAVSNSQSIASFKSIGRRTGGAIGNPTITNKRCRTSTSLGIAMPSTVR